MAADPTKALQSTAHHEAGHAVAAWCRGVPIKALSIQALGGTDGRFEHQPFVGDPGLSPFGLDDFRAQVEDLAVVLYAGPEAQRRSREATSALTPKPRWSGRPVSGGFSGCASPQRPLIASSGADRSKRLAML